MSLFATTCLIVGACAVLTLMMGFLPAGGVLLALSAVLFVVAFVRNGAKVLWLLWGAIPIAVLSTLLIYYWNGCAFHGDCF